MKITKQKAFELFNMDKPDPYNETMTFRSKGIAETAKRHYGGEIRETFIHKGE